MDRPARRSQTEILSIALREIRGLRRMKSSEVARAMGMAQRSYEHFEAGKGRIHPGRIHQFAKATDSDPYAILAALALDAPEFARRCADNKLMTILMVSVQEFDRDIGDGVAELDARPAINAFARTFRDLGALAVRDVDDVRRWLETRLPHLVAPDDSAESTDPS